MLNSEKKLLGILGNAFVSGDVTELSTILDENCKYHSDFSNTDYSSAKEILERMSYVSSKLLDDTRYYFNIIPVESVLKSQTDRPEQLNGTLCIDLSQGTKDGRVAIVFIKTNENGKINQITLSRDGKFLNTVFTQKCSVSEMPESYALINAEKYMDEYIISKGYTVERKEVSKRMIVYLLTKGNLNFILFVFAYGQNKVESFDQNLYIELLQHSMMEKGYVPLIAYLQVEERNLGYTKQYIVNVYSGTHAYDGEFWRIANINGRLELVTYLREGWLYLTEQFTKAYNRMDYNAFEDIFSDSVRIDEASGETYNGLRAVFSYLHVKKQETGNASIGYMRRNDIIYFSTPYLKDLYYIGFYITQENRIDRIQFYPITSEDALIRNGVIVCPEDYDDKILEV